MDSLDYAGPRINEGSKGVLLGLGEPIRALPSELQRRARPRACARRASSRPGASCVEAPALRRRARRRARASRATRRSRDWPLLVLTDDAERATRSAINFLWTTFTRFDPAARRHAARDRARRTTTPRFTPPIVIDARMKPGYPEELFCDDATRRASSIARWNEYFPGRRRDGRLGPRAPRLGVFPNQPDGKNPPKRACVSRRPVYSLAS